MLLQVLVIAQHQITYLYTSTLLQYPYQYIIFARKNMKEKKLNELALSKWILFVGIILTIIAPTILTLPTVQEYWNFSETGNIGDTIGGITSPVIGIVGAALLYLSIYLQYSANLRQDEALLNQTHTTYLQDLIQAISNEIKDQEQKTENKQNLEELATIADDLITNEIINSTSSIYSNQSFKIAGELNLLFESLNNEDLITNKFPLLHLHKQRAITLLNQFINQPETRIVITAGPFRDTSAKLKSLNNYLSKINSIINSWEKELMEDSELNLLVEKLKKEIAKTDPSEYL